jgi:hypothetical protein
VAAGDRNARGGADCRTTFENFAHRLGRDLVQRYAENGQRHDRLAAHGIDVGNRIGRGNAAEVVGIVHNRREEVGGRNHAGAVVKLPDRGIVGRLGSDQQLPVGSGQRLIGQELFQHRRRELAAAAATVGKTGQSHRGCRGNRGDVHDVHLIVDMLT